MTIEKAELFVLILIRISTMIIIIPIIGDRAVPFRIKVGLALLLTFLIFPFVPLVGWTAEANVFNLAFRMAKEVLIGVMIGFSARLIFAGIQLAGQLIGFQMGFSIVNVIDPINSEHVSIIAQLQYLFAALVFLSMNGHHIFLYAIAESFRIIPPLHSHFSGELMQSMVAFAGQMLEIALKTAAPIMAVLLFMSIGMGLVARTVPQINIFIIGFPLQIAVGLIGLGLTFPIFLYFIRSLFSELEGKIFYLLRVL